MKLKLSHLNLLTILILIVSVNCVFCQKTLIPQDTAVRIGKLSNGLTYYIRKNSRPEKRVELRLVLNAGSVLEDDDQLGLAHFCEHMCFNGTIHFPKNDLVHYLQSVGVNFGPEINGSTSFDETMYMLTLPSDSVNIINNGFQIMADWAHSVTFDTTEIGKERGVLVEEWRLGRGAGQRMRDKYLPVVLYGSKYASRLPIGTKESIQGSSFDVIKRYYKDWYRPDLMAFIVVGDINPDSVEQKVKTYFSVIPASKEARIRETYKIMDNKEPLVSIVSDKENTGFSAEIYFKTPKKVVKTVDDLRDQIRRSLFCSMLNQRLSELTKKPNAPYMSAGVGYGSFAVRTCDAFRASVQVKQDSIITGFKAVMTEIERARRFGFLQAELDRVKLNMLKGIENSYNERNKRESGSLIGALIGNYIDNSSIVDISFLYMYVKDNLPYIKLDDVNNLANEWIKDENRVLIIAGIEKDGVALPTENQMLMAFNDIKNISIDPYKEDKIAKELIPNGFKPIPSPAVSEKSVGQRGVTEMKLPNGVTVIYKQTDFKNDDIQLEAYSEGGQSLFGRDYKLAAQFATSIVTQGGVAQYSQITLSKMLSGKNVSLSPSISQLYAGFRGASSVADLETMFQLIHLYFTQPRRDSSTYVAFVQRTKEAYKNILANPQNYFYNEVNNILYRNCPEIPGALPTEEDWQNLSLDKSFDVYKKNFSNAANFTFIFVGSLKPEVIKPLAEMYLGSLPTTLKKETFVDKKLRPVEGPINESVYKGKDPKTIVVLYSEGKADWSKKYSHAFYSLGNILKRVYLDKLREDLSGVYGFSISTNLEKIPYESFNFSLTIPCAPENADKLVKTVYSEIDRMKKDGPTAEEFKKEIETQRRTEEVNDKDNYSWVFRIRRVYQFEHDFGRVDKPYELPESMTPELIKEVAAKYLDTSKMLRVTLYPENYKKDSAMK
jgi:zinc protease